MRCFRSRVPNPQKSRRLLLIKPEEVMLFQTGADILNQGAIAKVAFFGVRFQIDGCLSRVSLKMRSARVRIATKGQDFPVDQ